MKIVIAGAGAVGFHLAELLSRENQDITIIDTNETVLSRLGSNLDVLTIQGDACSASVLEQARIKKADLFISVTTSEKTNLLSAIVAKQLGVKRTIARISDPRHLEKINKKRFKNLGVDVMISPHLLAAQEIERLLTRASFTDLFEFEQGKISVVGFTLDTSSPLINKSLNHIRELKDDFEFRGIALLRGHETIIPEEDTQLQKGDHLYISTHNKYLEQAMFFAGKQLKPIKNVMIVGGTPLALRTAELLESRYNIKIVIQDEEEAKKFVSQLDRCLIINEDPGNVEALRAENLERMDAFIALTPNSETNIITSLMADELGVYKTIAFVDNVNYTHISQNIGIDTIINKKLIAANNIFRFVRKGKIEAIASLHGVDAEIIEFELARHNRILDHPIKDLHFPSTSVIAGIVRGEKSFIPDENTRFQLGDKVIIFALPEAIPVVEKIFR